MRSTVEKRFSVSVRTAKRDLSALRVRGLIGFMRSPCPGHYVLRKP